jgi:hypothetical protein
LRAQYCENVPSSTNKIRDIVNKYADKIKDQIIGEIKEDLQSHKLSIAMDEWTSCANKRYINIVVFGSKKFWNLGLIRYVGSTPAFKFKEIVIENLGQFSININNIVGCTTDGASVMVKLGKLITPVISQICLVHGIHLGVIKSLKGESADESLSDKEDDVESDLEDASEAEDESEVEDEDNATFNMYDQKSKTINYHPSMMNLIVKIRETAKKFKKSPLKNDLLQKLVLEEYKHNINLIIDCGTRWNSLLDMLVRFKKLLKQVKKVSIELNIDFEFSSSETFLLDQIISALQPVKDTVELLCREDSNLLEADLAFNFVINELKKQNNWLSKRLVKNIIEILEKRRTKYSDVLLFLQNDQKIETGAHGIFKTTSLKSMKATIKDLIETQIIKSRIEIVEEANTSDSEIEVVETLSFKEKLFKEISESNNKTDNNQNCSKLTVEKIIKNEMDRFMADHVRGSYLEKIYQYLMTIKPSSVEAERSFSVAGRICSKTRNSFSDSTLNL